MPSAWKQRPKRSHRALIAPLVVIIFAMVVAGVVIIGTSSSNTPASTSTTSTNRTSWALPQLNGSGLVRLSDFRGHPLVVTFFASWCSACKDELPAFAADALKLQGQVTFVGVDSAETSNGLAFAQSLGIGSWPLARDINGGTDSGLHDALGGTGMPITAFYRSNGSLISVAMGAVSAPTLSGDLQRYYGITVT